jgi:hypothetical protein
MLRSLRQHQWRDWDRRVDTLMRECKIDGTAKMVRPLTDVRKQGKVIEAWSDGEPQASRPNEPAPRKLVDPSVHPRD